MNTNDFKITFNQTSREVNIETFVACLTHTSTLVQEVNKELNTENTVEAKITSLKKGGQEIHIELVETAINPLFAEDAMSHTDEIIDIVSGLYSFTTFLGGKTARALEKSTKHTNVMNAKGETQLFNTAIINAYYGNKTIRKSLSKQFSALKNNKEVTSFSFDNNTDKIKVEKSQFRGLAKPSPTPNSEEKLPITSELDNQKISILRPSFTEDLKWDFIYDDQKLAVRIDDQKLLKVINHGEKFAKGDSLRVDLEVTKFYDEEVGSYVTNGHSYRITKFKEHLKAPAQRSLF
ncbi:MAG: hypothetical protein KGV50_01505 [Gammaproteobacteria bacterium]|nr:hypothetical protein [Gammaproteobacteria bacterium]